MHYRHKNLVTWQSEELTLFDKAPARIQFRKPARFVREIREKILISFGAFDIGIPAIVLLAALVSSSL